MVRLRRDTKTCNLFCNISATRLLSPNKRGVISPNFKFVLQQSECCKLRSYAILRGIHVTWCKISLPWTGKTRDMYNIFLEKGESLSTYCNNLSKPATTWFVARQVWFVDGKRATFDVAKRIAHFRCPFYRTLRETSKAVYNGTYTVVITCPALRSIPCSWAIHRAQTPSYKAVPSMLTVAPSGRTKRLMRLSIPLYSSVHLIVVGKVAALG